MLKKPWAAVWHPLQMRVLGYMWVATFCVTGSSLSSPSIPASPFSISTTLPKPLSGRNRKVYSVFMLPAIHKTFTITFLFANRMWCSITLTHLLLFDTPMQFSDGFLRVILSLGFPYVFASFIYILSLDEFILWPLQLHLKLFPFHFSQVRQLLISNTASSWDWIARANLSLTLQIVPAFEWSHSNPQFSPCLSLIFGTSVYYRWHHITSSTIL